MWLRNGNLKGWKKTVIPLWEKMSYIVIRVGYMDWTVWVKIEKNV